MIEIVDIGNLFWNIAQVIGTSYPTVQTLKGMIHVGPHIKRMCYVARAYSGFHSQITSTGCGPFPGGKSVEALYYCSGAGLQAWDMQYSTDRLMQLPHFPIPVCHPHGVLQGPILVPENQPCLKTLTSHKMVSTKSQRSVLELPCTCSLLLWQQLLMVSTFYSSQY